jgi:hypothetical protein
MRAAVLIAGTGTLSDGFVKLVEYATPASPVKKPQHSPKAQVEEKNF